MISIDLLIKLVFTYACVVTGMLFLACIFTPVIPFLVARISRNHVPHFIILGNRVKVCIGKLWKGMITTRNDGTFRETPGSGYLIKRIMCYFSFAGYGATMPLEYPAIIQALQTKGYPVHTYEDLKKIWDDKQATTTTKFDGKEITFAELKKAALEYAPGKTLIIGDLQYLFPTNDNPFVNEAKEAAEIAIERLKNKSKDYMKWILVIGAIVIIAYIAWTLFKNSGNTAPAKCVCEFPKMLGSNANISSVVKL